MNTSLSSLHLRSYRPLVRIPSSGRESPSLSESCVHLPARQLILPPQDSLGRRFCVQMNPSLAQQTALATFMAPIVHTFPESILRRIFDFLIQRPVILPPPRDDQRPVLTQVCQEWRRIIIYTPTYWSSFNFVESAVQPPNDLFRVADSFFRLPTDTIPLSISFGRSLQSDVGRNIFEFVIRPRADRIRFFSCDITKQALMILFGRDPVRFPVLEAIDVAVNCDLNGTITSRMPLSGSIDLSAFHRAPRLRDVKLHILGGIHPNDLNLPWGQLTRLDLRHTCVQVHTFLKILEASVVLEDGAFCVSFARYYDGQPTRLRRISVPLLRCLRLRLFEPSQDARLFGSLHIPLLEALWLERDEPEQAIRDMAIYETLLAGVNANIKHVTIAEHHIPMTRWFIPWLILRKGMTYQHLDGVFRLCGQLTTLFLCSGIFIQPLVLDKMATGEFLPLLEQLGVNSIHGWDIIWMVQRRNVASTFPGDSGPSSSPAARSLRPVALTYLRLFTMGGGLSAADAQALEDAATALDLALGYSMRHIDNAVEINPN
jgi:hypothetical protein